MSDTGLTPDLPEPMLPENVGRDPSGDVAKADPVQAFMDEVAENGGTTDEEAQLEAIGDVEGLDLEAEDAPTEPAKMASSQEPSQGLSEPADGGQSEVDPEPGFRSKSQERRVHAQEQAVAREAASDPEPEPLWTPEQRLRMVFDALGDIPLDAIDWDSPRLNEDLEGAHRLAEFIGAPVAPSQPSPTLGEHLEDCIRTAAESMGVDHRGTVGNATLHLMVEAAQQAQDEAAMHKGLAASQPSLPSVPEGCVAVTLVVRPHSPTFPALSGERALTQVERAQTEEFWRRRIQWARANHAYKDPDLELVAFSVAGAQLGPNGGATGGQVQMGDVGPLPPPPVEDKRLEWIQEEARAIAGGPTPQDMEITHLRAKLEALESAQAGTPQVPEVAPSPTYSTADVPRLEQEVMALEGEYAQVSEWDNREAIREVHQSLIAARRALREAKHGSSGPKLRTVGIPKAPRMSTTRGKPNWTAAAQGQGAAGIADSEVAP